MNEDLIIKIREKAYNYIDARIKGAENTTEYE